jgi:hypothetical protein
MCFKAREIGFKSCPWKGQGGSTVKHLVVVLALAVAALAATSASADGSRHERRGVPGIVMPGHNHGYYGYSRDERRSYYDRRNRERLRRYRHYNSSPQIRISGAIELDGGLLWFSIGAGRRDSLTLHWSERR